MSDYKDKLMDYQIKLKKAILTNDIDTYNQILEKRLQMLESLNIGERERKKVLKLAAEQVNEIQNIIDEQKDIIKTEINKNMDYKKNREKFKLYE